MSNTGSTLIAALEAAFAAIQARHSDLPEVMFITGTGADSRRRGLRLGHFHDQRWEGPGGSTPELFVAGEQLGEGGEATFCTLLHEATHALASRRRIKDTSRGGRYHNRQFVALAQELGLVYDHPEPDRSLGFSHVTMTKDTAASYASTINDLQQAITHHLARHPLDTTSAPKGRLLKATCGCDRIIRASAGVFEAAPITCGRCGEHFQVT